MEASSREALAAVREVLDEQTRGAETLLEKARERVSGRPRGASSDDLLAVSDELFAVSRLLEQQPTLRRALSDPAARPSDRAALVERLLGGKVSDRTLHLVQAVAQQRWSRPLDLVEALETLGTDAALAAAEAADEIDGVEDELFRFSRIVGGDPELSLLLSDPTATPAGKAEVLERLLTGKVGAVTLHLLRNVLTSSHVGTAETTVERLSEAASARRGQSVALVTTAVALTPAQEQRLTQILGRLYGRTIGLQVAVDPSVLGGLVIRVGDEVIDGSIAHRLEDAGRRLAG
jgi:F-type H+-transporting ATPase subunit delta